MQLISLSRQLAASQLPPSTAPVIIRTSRKVARKKAYQQERMESQLVKEVERKANNKARKDASALRKQAILKGLERKMYLSLQICQTGFLC